MRYTAGAGAPWTDACQVPVRLSGQDDWTYLSVPIVVRALDPQPELHTASLTVGPGETATFDLRLLTTWQLREDWSSIAYALDYDGAAFEVSLSGSTVTVVGSDRAVAGAEEAAVVTVTSHPGVAPARLILRVGAAPSTLPQGGSVSQQCSQAAGTSCTIPVIGAAGEVNPLPRTPLELIDVRATGACADVVVPGRLGIGGHRHLGADAPGGSCTAVFSRSGRTGQAHERRARRTLVLDLQGFPQTPASVSQTGFADGDSHAPRRPGRRGARRIPALSGFVIRSDGADRGALRRRRRLPGDQRTQRRAAHLRGLRGRTPSASRAPACGPIAWAYDPPAGTGSVAAARSSPTATAASSRSRSTASIRSGRARSR